MSDLSDTQIIERVEARLEEKEAKTPRHRYIEDIGFICAIFLGMTYGLAESARRVGWCHGDCTKDPGFPWVTITFAAMCILPKMLGRATSGKIWELAASRFGGKP